MRARNIKPGFFVNESLVECDPLARLLFAGLWCMANRDGRLEDKPKTIKMTVLPGDDCDVNALLDQLAKRNLIIRYIVDGQRYIEIPKFAVHQRPHHKEAPGLIPSREKVRASTDLGTCEPALIPDTGYLIPDPLPLESKGGKEQPKSETSKDEAPRTIGYHPEKQKPVNAVLEAFGQHVGRSNGVRGGVNHVLGLIMDGYSVEQLRGACVNAGKHYTNLGRDPCKRPGAAKFFGENVWLDFVDGVPPVVNGTAAHMESIKQKMRDLRKK